MSELRCPMCSQLNPADLEICQHCQARLKPLQVEPSTEDEFIQPDETTSPGIQAGSTTEDQDWFQTLRSIVDEGDAGDTTEPDSDWADHMREEPSHTGDSSAEPVTSDWLSRIRGDTYFRDSAGAAVDKSDETVAESRPSWSTQGGEAEPPDWLTGAETPKDIFQTGAGKDKLGRLDTPREKEPIEVPSEKFENIPDWVTDEESETSETPVPKETSELTGMLSFLKDGPEESDQAGAHERQQLDLPDRHEDEMPEPLDPSNLDSPDWLLDDTQSDQGKYPTSDEQGDEDLPDWLETGDQSMEPAELMDDDLPDWLPSIDSSDEEAPAEAVGAAYADPIEQLDGELADGDLPDWLLDGEPEDEAETAQAPAEELVAELPESDPSGEQEPIETSIPDEVSLPAWLLDGEEVSDTPASGEEEITEGLDEGESPTETPTGELLPTPDDEPVPEWLASSAEEMPEWLLDDVAELTALESVTDSDELPEWLEQDGLEAEPEAEGPEDQAEDEVDEVMTSLSRQAAVAAISIMAHQEDDFKEDDLSWLTDLEESYPELEPAEPDATTEPERRSEPSEPDSQIEKEPEPDLSEEFPEWLTSSTPEDDTLGDKVPETPTGPPIAEGEDELSPGELPGWLEAMRPVDSVAAAMVMMEADTVTEEAGPLAGLKGVLKAEPDISYARKPPAYSAKLQVTEKQQTNAEVLRQMVEAEGTAQPIPSTPVISSQYILRMVIFGLLVGAILIPILLDIPQFTAPTTGVIAADVLTVSQLIDRIPPGSPVLLAIDYEPGVSGEMDLYAGVVVEHLMAKTAYITLVSTLPTGSMQAERLFAELNFAGNYQYRSPENYINLGFIPGGAAGLLSFSVAPQQTLPLSVDGVQAWIETPLASVQNLSAFELAIVSTENPDNARAWIEQVQPRIGDTPMVIVASTQAEPVVRPYYEGIPQQVQGLLSGPAASGLYIQMVPTISKKDAQVFWTPFSVAVLLVSGLILIMGCYYAIMALYHRSRGSSEHEE